MTEKKGDSLLSYSLLLFSLSSLSLFLSLLSLSSLYTLGFMMWRAQARNPWRSLSLPRLFYICRLREAAFAVAAAVTSSSSDNTAVFSRFVSPIKCVHVALGRTSW